MPIWDHFVLSCIYILLLGGLYCLHKSLLFLRLPLLPASVSFKDKLVPFALLAFFSPSWLLLPSSFFTGPNINFFWELLVIYGKVC